MLEDALPPSQPPLVETARLHVINMAVDRDRGRAPRDATAVATPAVASADYSVGVPRLAAPATREAAANTSTKAGAAFNCKPGGAGWCVSPPHERDLEQPRPPNATHRRPPGPQGPRSFPMSAKRGHPEKTQVAGVCLVEPTLAWPADHADRAGLVCLNNFSASISGTSAGVRLPSGVAAG
jgi:hypothetical protein